jgi:multidrug efflux pump subunit AcrB
VFRWLARISVDNSVAVNLAVVTLCLAGVLTYLGMPREVFPVFSMQTVEVRTYYHGSSAEDVERLITLPLEDQLFAIDELQEMTSSSVEGISTITLKTGRLTEISDFLDDVRASVNRAAGDLPDEVDPSIVRELKTNFPVIGVYVYGWRGREELRRIAEDHRRELDEIPGISRVTVTGPRDPRIWIEVDPLALEAHDLSLAEVSSAVGAKSIDLPLGGIEGERTDTLLRIDSEVTRAADLLEVPVLSRPDGARVLLREVARLVDTNERDLTRARFNGQPSIHLQVNKEANGDTIDISRAVHAYLAAAEASLPEGVALGANTDLSIYVENRLEVMRSSALIGGLLVLISLVVFLSPRVALWTALGIPVSFLGGILIAGAVGVTMNMVTMFALIVVLGMIVDDAIVVGENVFRLMEEGMPAREAAIEGMHQVGAPVLATILTSVAAFLPILMVTGVTGHFLRPLPLVVSFCLAFSLLEAMLVLPSHLSHWSGAVRSVANGNGEGVDHWYWRLRALYLAFLAVALRWRYVTVTIAIGIAGTLSAYAAWWVPFNLFDDFESKIVYVNLRMLPGTSLDESERIATIVEERVLALPSADVESVNVLVGVSASDSNRYVLGQNLAQLWVELSEGESRERTTREMIEVLRGTLVDLPARVESTEVAQPQSGPTGRAIDIWIRGPELEVLSGISKEVQAELQAFEGVHDVHDNLALGKPRITILVRESARALGITERLLAAELRSAFEGTSCGTVRRGRDEVELIVKFPEELRGDWATLEAMRITLADGRRVALSTLAELHPGYGPSRITRESRERAVNVVADIDKGVTTSEEVSGGVAAALADLEKRHPGYRVTYKGDQKDTEESLKGFGQALMISLAVIFLILGSLFRSVTQPLVIMFIIGFGVVGVVLGHLVMDRSISLMSLIGLLALTGVVVNDSLILVEFVNQRRRAGGELMESLTEACQVRFRPILLTTITTMLGLTPLTFFATGQAAFLQPMAISLFFGLGVATTLVLVLVPCAYAILEDGLALLRRPKRVLGALRRNEVVH